MSSAGSNFAEVVRSNAPVIAGDPDQRARVAAMACVVASAQDCFGRPDDVRLAGDVRLVAEAARQQASERHGDGEMTTALRRLALDQEATAFDARCGPRHRNHITERTTDHG